MIKHLSNNFNWPLMLSEMEYHFPVQKRPGIAAQHEFWSLVYCNNGGVRYSNNGRNSTLHPETIYICILCRMLQNDHDLHKSFICD